MANELPEMGKISPEIFDELIYLRLGKKSDKILVGPRHGVDIGVADLGNGQVLVTTTDPVFIVPEYGFERAAWFATHILVSDAVTSGLPPTYLSIDLNLPLSMTKEELATMWSVIHRESEKMGMAVLSGHTARYEGCSYPMVGGATVICIGDADHYVTPEMAQVGNAVIITKGAAIEATGLFAVTFTKQIAEEFGEEFQKRSEGIFWEMSVVEDALTAASVGTRGGGVTAMHDATECGVWGGLYELAKASGVGMRIRKEDIIIKEEVEKICSFYGMEPYSSISEGTLILTCVENKAVDILKALEKKGIRATLVGEVIEEKFGILLKEGKEERPLDHPRIDPFWPAFGRALEGLK
ncbi:MAG: AIR synthase family protein [Candidatus Zixiibacteriota bacterium]